MRPLALVAAALVACQGCTGEISGGFSTTDGGDAESGASGANGLAGAYGSAGTAASGGGSGSGGVPGSGGRGGVAGMSSATGGIGGISAAGGAKGTGGANGAGGGVPKPCGLDSASCNSCLGPICPDAIQACGTSTSCLDALTLLAGCLCPAAPNSKTSDQCLIDLAARSAVAAPLAKCMQSATTCKSLCGL